MIRRKRRGRRDAVRKDQQPMSEPAPEAERGKQQPYGDVLRRHPGGEREGHQHDGAGKRRVSLRHLRRIVGGEVARRQIVERVAERGDERDQHRPMQRAESGMHHQKHAEEACEDRHHAMPANPFVQQRPGKERDQQRREKEDGDRLVELQVSQRDEIEPGGDDHDQ